MSCSSCGTVAPGTIPSGCGNNGHCSSGGCSKMEVRDWLSDISLDNFTKYNIYEVSFKNGSRKGYFRNDKKMDIHVGDLVVVEVANLGYDIGQITLSGELVKLQMKKRKIKESSEEIKSILRLAREKEMEVMQDAREKEKETMLKARVLARNLNLNMKLGDVEYQADGKKATFNYTADGRVDFRELIKVLALEFKVRIEMRQIGARQEAGIVGGIGSCGRELCCSTWMTSFKSVNTTAARYQNLSINQTKLSGQCGRLKCCLNFELDSYLDALKHVPNKAERLFTQAGDAKLMKTDILKGIMFYQIENTGKFYPITIENVKYILDLNTNGKKPEDLKSLAVVEKVSEEVVEFTDLVGHITLPSLTKKKNNNKNKNRNKNTNTTAVSNVNTTSKENTNKINTNTQNNSNKPSIKSNNTARKFTPKTPDIKNDNSNEKPNS